MNIAALETFYLLSIHRNFRKVATLQGTTQPAISARVRGLEATLGVQLIMRDRRRFALTEAGNRALAEARRVLDAHAQLMDAFADEGTFRQTIRFGTVDSIARSWLPALMRRLVERYPDLTAELTIDTTDTLHQQIIDGDVSMAVTIAPVAHAAVTDIPLCHYDMAWVAHPRLIESGKVYALHELARLPIIRYPAGSAPDQIYGEIFTGIEHELVHVNASNSMSTMLWLATEGLGVAAIPPAAIDRYLSEGRLVEVETTTQIPPVPFVLSLVDLPRNPVQRRLVREIEDVVRGYCATTSRTTDALEPRTSG